MDILNIQSLIKQGKLVKLTDIDPTKTYLQIGVFQKGNRENNASNANTYESYAIELSEIAGSGGLIVVTKAELDVLITTNTLVAGAFYKVLGVDTPLYGGTDIIVQALSNNKISEDGVGFFYNPDYSQHSIYNPYIRVITSASVGEFNFNEEVINDLGSKGYIIGNFLFTDGSFGYINYDYPSNIDIATTLTGTVTGATVNFTIDSLPDFTLGTKVIWGGRVWVNINNTRGSIIDPYNLSTDAWTPIPYNDTDYVYVMDPIKYDYENDFLSYREEADADNTVLATFKDTTAIQGITGISYFVNAIKAFQWGNQYSFNSGTGTLFNHVENSYFECINFKSQIIVGTKLSQVSTIYNIDTVGSNTFDINTFDSQTTFNNVFFIDSTFRFNKFESNSYLNGLIIQSSIIDFNQGFNADMYSIYLHNGGITQNYLNSSFFGNLNFIYGNLYENNLIQGSYITTINLRNFSYIAWNVLTAQSSITFGTFTLTASVNYNTLSNNSSIVNNTLNGTLISRNVLTSLSNIGGNTFDAGALTQNNLTSSSIYNNLFDNTQVSFNTLDGNSNIGYNDLESSTLNYNKLSNSSAINNNNLITGSVNQNILINEGFITNCNINGTSEIEYNLIENNSTILIVGEAGTQVNRNTVSNFSLIQEPAIAVQNPVILYNIVNRQSKITNNNWGTTGSITNNHLSYSEISGNIINSGNINYCNLNNSFIINNNLANDCYIQRCSLDLGTISSCDLGVDNYLSDYILLNSTITNWGITLVTTVTSPSVTFINIQVSSLSTFPLTGIFQGMSEYVDNTAAVTAGLKVGQLYRITGTGSVQVVI